MMMIMLPHFYLKSKLLYILIMFDKSNVVAIWPYQMILLVIISNNIPLNPPIALTYHLVPKGSSF